MSLAIKILKLDYLNQDINNMISTDNQIKNINNLNASIINVDSKDKLCIKWNDCPDTNWQKNVIVRALSYVPADVFNNKIIETSYIKDQYSINGFLDGDIIENTLYCYRIFTQFADLDEYYSGLKNIFFVYVFNNEAINPSHTDDKTIIHAAEILLDSTHQFVTQDQIAKWNNVDISNIDPNKINIDSTHKFVTDDQINKWNNNVISNIDPNIITTDSDHRFITDKQINKWDNINPNTIITDLNHRFVSDDQISKWNSNTSQSPTTISADVVSINNSLGDNFNPKNVEDALKQLFTCVINSKTIVASAINDKSGNTDATNDMTFNQLADLVYKVDNLERQNLILNFNNKFDLKVPLDTTFDKLNSIISNFTLDSVKKTCFIYSTVDFSSFTMAVNTQLSNNMNLTKGEITLEYVMDFSKFNIGVII